MKKKRTKQQKIIANLKRQLKQQAVLTPVSGEPTPVKEKKKWRKEKIKQEVKPIKKEDIKSIKKENKDKLFNYNPGLIKKSLIKTAILSLLFLGAILFIQKFLHF